MWVAMAVTERSVMSSNVRSAGLLPYRVDKHLEVLIAHPGGPWFAGRDEGSWSIVKGIVKPDEKDRNAAIREFEEETGWTAPREDWVSLGETTLRSRKVVVAWAVAQHFDPSALDPGLFQMNGQFYPEIDRVEWFLPSLAKRKLNSAQGVFIDRLESHLRLNGP
jgi:predicted NUDIX family NTP pyrophosphohydrolase